tara:strand:+ start:634 stop:1113 length:480 start_codon:yes stop_codon:yes gene_type:complete
MVFNGKAISNNIILRLAVKEDCKCVYEWRNHPGIRKDFFNPSPISFKDHELWFTNALNSESIELLIGMDKDDPVGSLRYDIHGDKAEVSVYVKPGFHGKGIGTEILMKGNAWLKENMPETKNIFAKIISKNTSSVKAFKKAGYIKSHVSYVFCLKEGDK